MGLRRLGRFAHWLKQFQTDGKGMVREGFAVNDVRARIKTTGDGSQRNILIGLPRPFRQNADTVIADVDGGSNFVCGALKTAEFDQHLFWNAPFGPDRRKWICHGFLLPAKDNSLPGCASNDPKAAVRRRCKSETRAI